MHIHKKYPVGSRFMAPASDAPDLTEVEVVGHGRGPDLQYGGRRVTLIVRQLEGDQRPYEIESGFLE